MFFHKNRYQLSRSSSILCFSKHPKAAHHVTIIQTNTADEAKEQSSPDKVHPHMYIKLYIKIMQHEKAVNSNMYKLTMFF